MKNSVSVRITLFALLLLPFVRPAGAASLSVPDTAPWYDTGINVAAGDILNISAMGTVVYGPDFRQVTDANGFNFDGQQFFASAVLPLTTIVSLIGKIGGTTSLDTGTPVPEGTSGNGVGFVGTSYSKVMSTSGRLFLGFNDQIEGFGDNSGFFSVEVSVVPEPSSFALFGVGALAVFLKRAGRKIVRSAAR